MPAYQTDQADQTDQTNDVAEFPWPDFVPYTPGHRGPRGGVCFYVELPDDRYVTFYASPATDMSDLVEGLELPLVEGQPPRLFRGDTALLSTDTCGSLRLEDGDVLSAVDRRAETLLPLGSRRHPEGWQLHLMIGVDMGAGCRKPGWWHTGVLRHVARFLTSHPVPDKVTSDGQPLYWEQLTPGACADFVISEQVGSRSELDSLFFEQMKAAVAALPEEVLGMPRKHLTYWWQITKICCPDPPGQAVQREPRSNPEDQ